MLHTSLVDLLIITAFLSYFILYYFGTQCLYEAIWNFVNWTNHTSKFIYLTSKVLILNSFYRNYIFRHSVFLPPMTTGH
jgi:hypothetical protein